MDHIKFNELIECHSRASTPSSDTLLVFTAGHHANESSSDCETVTTVQEIDDLSMNNSHLNEASCNEHDGDDEHNIYITSSYVANRAITPSSRNSSGDCLLPVDDYKHHNIHNNHYPYTHNKLLNQQAMKHIRQQYLINSSPVIQEEIITSSSNAINNIGNNNNNNDLQYNQHETSMNNDDITISDALQFDKNTILFTIFQIFSASILAGLGNVGAGLLLNEVQNWNVFKNLSELYILVPSLLGLKGNLEMTMVSRLSTQANLGNMRDWKETSKMAKGNLCLIQCQATTVAFLASIIAIVINIIRESGHFDLQNALILCASSLITANIACFLLGSLMVLVIIVSHRVKMDPDNIAAPIAASLGDVITLALLALFAQFIYNHTQPSEFPLLALFIIIIFLSLLPLWFLITYKNEYTKDAATYGWSPVLIAMVLSCIAGFILEISTSKFEKIAVYQPVINGVGGNLVAVQSSRISTYLHRNGKLGEFPLNYTVFKSPLRAFLGKPDINVIMARILLFMALPAHILFLIVIRIVEGYDKVELTPAFMITYLVFALLQVLLLLYFAYNLISLLWKRSVDPDNSSIPILTACGDLFGTGFLMIVFIMLSLFNDPNASIAK